MSAASPDARTEMNAMYRWTRHVYDISRKFYLLGRDTLISNLDAADNDLVCEVGCGTARNLVKMARRYPGARFYGIDASDEMLKTAAGNTEFTDVETAQGYAQNFDAAALFNVKAFDKIVFSYALSIIPPWQDSIDHALTLLKPGGEIHIVDFGGLEELPGWFRALLFWWLRLFHVYHKPEILSYLQELQESGKGHLGVRRLCKGYAYLAVFVRA